MKPRSAIALAFCLVESMLFGGAIFAWGPMLYTFQQDNIYREKCTFTNVTKETVGQNSTTWELEEDCTDQAQVFNLAFTLGIASMGIISFPCGVFFDKFGLRATRIILSITSVLGLLSWSFASPDLPWLVYTGAIMNGMSLIIFVCVTANIGELAGSKTGLFVSMFNGGINSSAFSYGVFQIMYDNGIHRKWTLLVVASLWILGTLNTLLLLPKYKVGVPEKNEKQQDTGNKEKPTDQKIYSIENKVDEKTSEPLKTSDEPLKDSFLSPYFISHVVWFCIGASRSNIFYGFLVPWLTDIYPDDDDKVSFVTSTFGLLSIACIPVAAITGIMLDYFRKKNGVTDKSSRSEKANAAVFPLLAATLSGTLMSFTNIFREEWTIYLTIAVQIFFVTSFYSSTVRFLSQTFPQQHFGKLLGFMLFLGSSTQFVQIPLLSWAENDSFTTVFIVITVATAVSLFHPIHLMIRARKWTAYDVSDPRNNEDC